MHRTFTHHESAGSRRPLRSLTALTALTALSALLLAGCSSAGSTGTSTEAKAGNTSAQDRLGAQSAPGANSAPAASAPDGGAPAAGAPAAKPAPGAAGEAGSQPAPGLSGKPAEVSKPGAPAVGVGPKLTKNASLDLRVKNIEAAAAKVRAVATGLQAQVLSEQIGRGGPGDPVPLQNGTEGSGTGSSGEVGGVGDFGTLTLAVPANKLDTALDQLTRIGTLLRRNASSSDVTAQYVDTESRLKSMRASVTRVRALMAQAKDLGQVVALEGELSRREAELESLESQLSSLDTNIERSTVTVSLTASGSEEPVAKAGFGAGLRAGWDAFTASAAGLFKGIGAALPFLVFFALVGAPVVWWLRRRRAASMSPVSASKPSGAEASGPEASQ